MTDKEKELDRFLMHDVICDEKIRRAAERARKICAEIKKQRAN